MSKLRVLVVDDEQVLRKMLVRVLEKSGYEIAGEAENGKLGVEAARATRPDLILMDVRMPEMNGIDATRVIKQMDPDVTILMSSAYSDASLMKAADEAGAAGWVIKGTALQELVDSIERMTKPRRLSSAHDEGSRPTTR